MKRLSVHSKIEIWHIGPNRSNGLMIIFDKSGRSSKETKSFVPVQTSFDLAIYVYGSLL